VTASTAFSPRARRNLLVGLVLLLPFVAVGAATRAAVPRVGDAVARALRDGARALQMARPRRLPPKPEPQFVVPSRDVIALDAGAVGAGAPSLAGDKSSRAPGMSGAQGSPPMPPPQAVAAAPLGPVHIGADAVQRAIDDDGRSIRARTTRGPDGRPAGARVTGVNGAGLGLRDGDVIIAVDGKPTMDDDAATDAALSAVARGASVLHATLTRDGQPFEVVLDLPLAPAKPGNSPARR
jgi:hypothetical protein